MKKVMFLGTVLLLTSLVYAQSKCPLSESQNAEIRARGTLLAEYDQIAWHGSDAVMALKPPEGSVTGYVARKVSEGWTLVFGRFSEDSSKYIVAYEVQQQPDGKYLAKKLDREKTDDGVFFDAARALATARQHFEKQEHAKRPYNFSIIPNGENGWFVYAVPAQTNTKIYPLGGDYRFFISRDGLTVLETRRLHKSILEIEKVPEGAKEAAGYHTHVLSELPEDTDVFHVLARQPKVPEYVATKEWVYIVSPDKPIACIPMKAFEKAGK